MSKDKKKKKKLKKKELKKFSDKDSNSLVKVKSKCCDKYKKSESKRCKKCPCFDLLKNVA
jgi:hypothetical protein